MVPLMPISVLIMRDRVLAAQLPIDVLFIAIIVVGLGRIYIRWHKFNVFYKRTNASEIDLCKTL